MNQVQSMANDFNKSALDQIAQSAWLRASLLPSNEADAIHAFITLAKACEAVIKLQK